MAEIRTLKVDGFYEAILGMRNAFKTRDKIDSEPDHIGEADEILMNKLLTSKFECDAKFMRMIIVWSDWYMSRMVWPEIDTYHFNSKNSESTMHTLLSKDGEFKPFMFEQHGADGFTLESIKRSCDDLNYLRSKYQAAKAIHDSQVMNETLRQAKLILPESFIQMRTVCTNYAELRHMYMQRKNHRLWEWNTIFVDWIKTLPYSELITGESNDRND